MTKDPQAPTPPENRPPEAVPGRGVKLIPFALQRLRRSPLLQACLVVSFLCYGGMTALLVAGRLADRPTAYGPGFVLACVVTLLSLASWFLLLLWYPTLEATRRSTRDRAWIGTSLEFFAVGCVTLVTALMAIIVVYVARN